MLKNCLDCRREKMKISKHWNRFFEKFVNEFSEEHQLRFYGEFNKKGKKYRAEIKVWEQENDKQNKS